MQRHYCGELGQAQVGAEVSCSGWVHRRRDHGGVIFIDLRDREGIIQIVVNPEDKDAFSVADAVRPEYVIRVQGKLSHRPAGTENADRKTGMVELIASKIDILNKAVTPPFQVEGYQEVNEDIRLKYRYIDMRRPEVLKSLRFRCDLVRYLRRFMDNNGFLDIETPVLTRSTPEGARDYLVPSRTHQGQFFALPQSPQVMKQLLMAGGLDRYYQIVKCFRDEDLRADRQPEFTQLDIEMSFASEQDVMTLMESMIRGAFEACLHVSLPDPFPIMTYADAMAKYGSDRPDLRVPLTLVDIEDIVRNSEFKVFSDPASDPNGRVSALCVPGGATMSRGEIDDYTRYVGIYGAKGLAYIKVDDRDAGRQGLKSPIVKFLSDEALEAVLTAVNANTGDLLFFGAGSYKVVTESLGALRTKVGHDRGLLEEQWCPLWVVDFPMFERNADNNGWQALHHPFTAPSDPSVEALQSAPQDSVSRAYDMVLNGCELGGGSVRIHDYEMQLAALALLGIDEVNAKSEFGHLLEALTLGCPPHAGIAFGIDRIAMMMSGASSIREVIAFPKTQSAYCPLTQAPSTVDTSQLDDLAIRLKAQAKVSSESAQER